MRVLWHHTCQTKINADEQQQNFVLTAVVSGVAPAYLAVQACVIIYLSHYKIRLVAT